eukprot:2803808-Rhodomonas_salina.1
MASRPRLGPASQLELAVTSRTRSLPARLQRTLPLTRKPLKPVRPEPRATRRGGTGTSLGCDRRGARVQHALPSSPQLFGCRSAALVRASVHRA